MAELLDALQLHFIEADVLRSPNTDSSLHPLWKAPSGGPVAPKQGRRPYRDDVLVASAFVAGGVATGYLEGFVDMARNVDIRIRSMDHGEAERVARAIHRLIGDHQNYDLGTILHIEWSHRLNPLQLISTELDTGYDFLLKFSFMVRDAAYDAA